MILNKIKNYLESFIEIIGKSIAWLTLFMVLVTFLIVVLRYVFGIGWIALQESVVWMHAAVFMLGASYTLRYDEHVRVDIFYRDMSLKRRAMVDFLGTVLFLIPPSLFPLFSSWDYVASSWMIREASREVGGLPFPFYSILKSFIPLMASTLIIQSIVIIIKSSSILLAKCNIENKS